MLRKTFASSLLLFLSALPAAGSGVGPLPVAEALAKGERVFVGQLIDVSSRWGEGRRMIWTDYLFQVEEGWAGTTGDRAVVSVAGGTADGETMIVSHVSSFEIGETYLVSAWQNARLFHSAVLGGDRGSYRRAVDEATGEEIFVDPNERRVEIGPDGTLGPGRVVLPAGRPGLVRVPSDDELAFRRAALPDELPVPLPVYTDPFGRVVPPLPAPAPVAAPDTCPARRADLRRAAETGRGVPDAARAGAK